MLALPQRISATLTSTNSWKLKKLKNTVFNTRPLKTNAHGHWWISFWRPWGAKFAQHLLMENTRRSWWQNFWCPSRIFVTWSPQDRSRIVETPYRFWSTNWRQQACLKTVNGRKVNWIFAMSNQTEIIRTISKYQVPIRGPWEVWKKQHWPCRNPKKQEGSSTKR